jgi:hypothetical protein
MDLNSNTIKSILKLITIPSIVLVFLFFYNEKDALHESEKAVLNAKIDFLKESHAAEIKAYQTQATNLKEINVRIDVNESTAFIVRETRLKMENERLNSEIERIKREIAQTTDPQKKAVLTGQLHYITWNRDHNTESLTKLIAKQLDYEQHGSIPNHQATDKNTLNNIKSQNKKIQRSIVLGNYDDDSFTIILVNIKSINPIKFNRADVKMIHYDTDEGVSTFEVSIFESSISSNDYNRLILNKCNTSPYLAVHHVNFRAQAIIPYDEKVINKEFRRDLKLNRKSSQFEWQQPVVFLFGCTKDLGYHKIVSAKLLTIPYKFFRQNKFETAMDNLIKKEILTMGLH